MTSESVQLIREMHLQDSFIPCLLLPTINEYKIQNVYMEGAATTPTI